MASASNIGNTVLLRGGRVVNADEEFVADVLVQNDKIVQVAPNIKAPAADANVRIIDCTGKLIIPGGIDPHTHCELPFMGQVAADDFEYGTKAAVAGGTTMLIDFAIPNPGQNLLEVYKTWRGRADPKVVCDYGLHMAVTWWDGLGGKVAKDMQTLVQEHGVTSFKCFMAYKGVFMVRDDEMLQIFETCAELGALPQVHAENGDAVADGQARMLAKGITGPEGHVLSRPEDVEAEATYRACLLADRVNSPVYIVHVMSKLACDAVKRARAEGKLAFGEPIAAGLGTDGCNCWHESWRTAAAFVMGPPLRPDPTVKWYLMKHLATGDLQTVGTDNCTFNGDQKALGKDDFTKIPNGVNGIQDRLAVVWTNGVMQGTLTPSQFVAVTSTNVAKLFGLYPRKGVIRVGADADIVVWNPVTQRTVSAKTHMHKVDFNIFEGMTLWGVPDITLSRGRVVWENDGKVDDAHKGRGEYIPRKSFAAAYDSVQYRAISRDKSEQPVTRDSYTGPVAGVSS